VVVPDKLETGIGSRRAVRPVQRRDRRTAGVGRGHFGGADGVSFVQGWRSGGPVEGALGGRCRPPSASPARRRWCMEPASAPAAKWPVVPPDLARAAGYP